MRYYQDVRNVNRKVDDVVKNLLEKGGSIELDIVVLNLTNMYAVSEKMIEKRFLRWVDAYDELVFDGRIVACEKAGGKK